MKIAFIQRKFRAGGGAECFAMEFVSFALKQGHHVTVFASSWDPEPLKCFPDQLAFRKVPVIPPKIPIE